MITRTLGIALTVLTLSACVAPTPYRPAEDGRFGYTSSKISEQLYRVQFTGSQRTPVRAANAYVLLRSAELAQAAGAPAFAILEGKIDAAVMSGDENFGLLRAADVDVALATSRVPAPDRTAARSETLADNDDRLVGPSDPALHRTAGSYGGFHAPAAIYRAPASAPKAQAPVYIYTPGYDAPAQPLAVSVLVQLRPDLKEMDERTYVTADVIGRLGPRVKRPAPV